MHQKTNHFILYLTTALLTSIILFWVIYAKGFNIHLPRSYELDALFSGSGIKTIIDSGWILSNPYLGAPLTFSLLDYPGSDSASFYIIKLLALFSHDYAVVMNSFFFLTFLLTALVSLFVLKRLGLRSDFAMVASILFTFIPYHIMRGEAHLFLTTLYVIPIYVLMIFSVYSEDPESRILNWKIFLACVFAASSGIYYAFFACYFLLITGILAGVYQQRWRPVIKSMLIIAVIMLTVIANTLPTIIYSHQYGKNLELGQRDASDSELVGLKISQMLLPVDTHRVHFMKILRQYYNRTAPMVNENNTATLGLIGSLGFIILLLLLFSRNKIESDKPYLLSRLNISAVLLGTIGGLGSIYAYLISPTIRSYNRISVFIAFFAIFIFFLLIQAFVQKRQFGKAVSIVIAILLLIVGIADQVEVKRNPDYQVIQSTYNSDAKFIGSIESTMPKNSMIFQLPVAAFPENPTIHSMTDYQLFRGYLHSHTLRWSYGAVRGRKIIKWQQYTAHLPVSEMLDELVYAGFTGIYIDRDGYLDNGKSLEAQLENILKQKPLVSDDNTLVFFDLRDYVNNVQNIMQRSEWFENILRVQHDLLVEMRWVDGFNHHEDEFKDNKRWSRLNAATIRVTNYYYKPVHLYLSFNIKTASPGEAHMKITGDVLNEDLLINQKPLHVAKEVTLSPGAHYIYFKTDAKESELQQNQNKVYFRVEDFTI